MAAEGVLVAPSWVPREVAAEDHEVDVQAGAAEVTFVTCSEEAVVEVVEAMALDEPELGLVATAVAKCKREASGRASGTCGHPYTVLVAACD